MEELILLSLRELPTVIDGAEHLWAFIQSQRTAMSQRGEWTDEMEQGYRARLLATKNDPDFQPERTLTRPTPATPPVVQAAAPNPPVITGSGN